MSSHNDNHEATAVIDEAIGIINEMSQEATNGKWLESLVRDVAPHLREWDIAQCYTWADWPKRKTYFPNRNAQDTGIDLVAIRLSDGKPIAIQCKARQIKPGAKGSPISKMELDKFIGAAASETVWAERWLVINGDCPVSPNTNQEGQVKVVNLHADLADQRDAAPVLDNTPCPHCDDPSLLQTRQCMQDEAVRESVRILREHAQADDKGQARGRLILPCGTGKTRISLRIVEDLTPPGQLAVVLCPSIALVAQLRREYLQHAKLPLHALAVCSDATAGYNPGRESSRNTLADPTLDTGNVSAREVKGQVTTEPDEIAAFIRQGQNDSHSVSVIFGTYQSGSRVAAALQKTGVVAQVLIADEAHRTAGLRRKQADSKQAKADNRRLRDFTLCHDADAFPAVHRIYQTATPRQYSLKTAKGKKDADAPGNWIVRNMDDESVFGVELYRKSYGEAVRNGWLADYRIIALAVNDPETHRIANQAASAAKKLTTPIFLRGLAFTLALGGAANDQNGNGNVPVKSCIGFMNTVAKSREMAEALQTEPVRRWLQDWLDRNRPGRKAPRYQLEHLDAKSNVAARDDAKRKLGAATAAQPYGVLNVGIFGEGADAPSLSAVGFLEARKSPIDVIQAVGRAMRTSPGKEMGYIICPIVIPPHADPETWLSHSDMEEGWQELGQILQALRAHDSRIEDSLSELMQIYVPAAPEITRTVIAYGDDVQKRIKYREHQGPPGHAEKALARVLDRQSELDQEFPQPLAAAPPVPVPALPLGGNAPQAAEPDYGQIVSGKRHSDGSREMRRDTVAREKPAADGAPGAVNLAKTKAKARKMINDGAGQRIPDPERAVRPRRQPAERAAANAQLMLDKLNLDGREDAISMNLLSKSGLTGNRVVRDLNLLEAGVKEAAHHLRADSLQPDLDRHFGYDRLDAEKHKDAADGCTVAALLLMNAAMLHQRIANGGWLSADVRDLASVKNDVNVIRAMRRQWQDILTYDFRPILEPAVKVIEAVEDSGKDVGLQRALRHIAAEAERIAETYADMGTDHAGPLFNRVMGNQASDGAYFTRPVAASLAAHLTLDACGERDWTSADTWREFKIVDLACGSGTLLAAMLTEMKRRAREQGADAARLAELQQLAVEDTIKGLDINPVSLQLAASQLTAGNREIRYKRMGLWQMPYGPQPDNPSRVMAGTLELLGRREILPRRGELTLGDDTIAAREAWEQKADGRLDDPVAAKDARVVIMNPPFTNRKKMGEKFTAENKVRLQQRVDWLGKTLANADHGLMGFLNKNSIRPLFVALAGLIEKRPDAVTTMVQPTIALSTTSGLKERKRLAQDHHVHTVLTCHQPNNVNLSQNTGINESIVVMRRYNEEPKPKTRFINLDQMPTNENEADELHIAISKCREAPIPNGWGQITQWAAERIAAGDYTAAIWRATDLAKAASKFATNPEMSTVREYGYSCTATNAMMDTKNFVPAKPETPGSFPVVSSKSADGQTTIRSHPDAKWQPTHLDDRKRIANGGNYPEVDKLLQKAGHLLITSGQNTATGRITAIASDDKHVGRGWLPIMGPSQQAAKAICVFINSTPGRLQLLCNVGRTLAYPQYNPTPLENIRIPDVRNDARVRQILADCWEQTKDTVVPQFRDGECEVRQIWDAAVAEAMGWDPDELTRLRLLLHQEPHVRGLGYHQYADDETAHDAVLDDTED